MHGNKTIPSWRQKKKKDIVYELYYCMSVYYYREKSLNRI